MRRQPPPYYRPVSLTDAVGLWQRFADARFLAGGSLLLATPPTSAPLIDLTGLPETQAFGPIVLPDGRPGWRIGACRVWGDLCGAALPPGLSLWQTAAEEILTTAVRAVGTLGGSWVAADGGDARLAQLACGGQVTYVAQNGAVAAAETPPPGALVLHFDLPVPDHSVWVGFGARGSMRYRAALTLTEVQGHCQSLRLVRRWGLAPPERWTVAEEACRDLPRADLPDRLRTLAAGDPLGLLLARRVAEAA